jgi:RNA polymerase sigma factor (sigma-70 family)
VGNNQDDAYAVRRAELDTQFHALPPVGTAEYWRSIENAPAEQSLPLEVVTRCCRERLAAGAVRDSERIFECMVRRTARAMDIWAWRIARHARDKAQRQLREDLEQECYMKLWEELADDGPTFLLENFAHALNRLQQHVAHDVMEKAGEWQRPGTATSSRVPRGKIASLQAEPGRDDEDPMPDRLADPAAEQAFERADLSDLRDLVTKLPPELRDLILDRFWRGISQEEIAAERNITARTVYNRLKAVRKQLGVRYAGDEGDGHGR